MESADSHRLRQEIERSLRGAFDLADILPRLARLVRLAAPASDDGVFAHRQLAELLVERHPWRAATHAKKAISVCPSDDRAWAVLALCHTLLGHFRSSAAAYERAIACAPGHRELTAYSHNLGHVLDVALGEPERSLPWLASAYDAKTGNAEILASYVHALARAGNLREARRILDHGLEDGVERADGCARGSARELLALSTWLDRGAPAQRHAQSREGEASKNKRGAGPKDRRLALALERGLKNLPLDQNQRDRALALARDAPPPRPAARGQVSDDVAGLAAAVAYAIVYVDHLPLSQAEVAAPFRVAVARLRGRFAELRAQLDLIPGDTRYRTVR